MNKPTVQENYSIDLKDPAEVDELYQLLRIYHQYPLYSQTCLNLPIYPDKLPLMVQPQQLGCA